MSYCLMFFFKQKTAYDIRISDWSSDVCSSDLSVSLLANANYDPHIALSFWRAYGPAHGSSIFNSRTHPDWKTRVAVITRAIAQLGPERPHRPALLDARERPLDGDWPSLLGTAADRSSDRKSVVGGKRVAKNV